MNITEDGVLGIKPEIDTLKKSQHIFNEFSKLILMIFFQEYLVKNLLAYTGTRAAVLVHIPVCVGNFKI